MVAIEISIEIATINDTGSRSGVTARDMCRSRRPCPSSLVPLCPSVFQRQRGLDPVNRFCLGEQPPPSETYASSHSSFFQVDRKPRNILKSLPRTMSSFLARTFVVVAAIASSLAVSIDGAYNARNLPVIYFHGIGGFAAGGTLMAQNLSTDARPWVGLDFCEGQCSFTDLNAQTTQAIQQVRSIVANDTRFQNGYSFVAHSQGSAVARAVIEEMDDHKVHTFISLAGAANGIFYGPQPSDFLPSVFFLQAYAPLVIDPRLLNISTYSVADIPTGRLTIDTIKLQMAYPQLQSAASAYQLNRSPIKSSWVQYNKFLAVINNLKPIDSFTVLKDRMRRRTNFMRLKAAHFFGSPFDEVIAPWQTSILGKYNDVASIEELEANFQSLQIVSMKDTDEYKFDTYGLRTLDRRGDLTLNTIQKVTHGCWLADNTPAGRTEKCSWRPVFEKSVYPILKSHA